MGGGLVTRSLALLYLQLRAWGHHGGCSHPYPTYAIQHCYQQAALGAAQVTVCTIHLQLSGALWVHSELLANLVYTIASTGSSLLELLHHSQFGLQQNFSPSQLGSGGSTYLCC
jgi:hypothetical protein